jgi:hypothetical protein
MQLVPLHRGGQPAGEDHAAEGEPRGGWLLQLESSRPIALESARFQPLNLSSEKTGFKPLLSQMQLVPLHRGVRQQRGPAPGAGHSVGGSQENEAVRGADAAVGLYKLNPSC